MNLPNPLQLLLVLMGAFLLPIYASETTNNKHILSAIDDPTRQKEHIERDKARLPAKILSYLSIEQGSEVAELAAGSGYYAALLSRAVGDNGTVYAVDPSLIFDYFPQAKETFNKFMQLDPRSNIHYSVQRMDELKIGEPVDAVLMALYYHDTIWTGENRPEMNRAIYQALKPGGRFVVIDHHAVSGADADVNKQLHRMDASIVIPEVTAAGFVLVEKSSVLSNSSDPRTQSVFLPEWKGKTDRFVYVFERPKKK